MANGSMIQNLRELAENPEAQTQKFLLSQTLAALADILANQEKASAERRATKEMAQKNKELLDLYGKVFGAVGIGAILWIMQELLTRVF